MVHTYKRTLEDYPPGIREFGEFKNSEPEVERRKAQNGGWRRLNGRGGGGNGAGVLHIMRIL